MHNLSQLRTGELVGIKRLSLSQNLTEFPFEILTLADSLEVLDLSHNSLSSLPSELAQLTKLKIIFVSYNKFDHLPEVLGSLPNLEMIGFRSNTISHVSEKSLPTRLRWLTLTDNLIETLPNSLGHRPRLQKLMLSGNKLSQLPQTLKHATNLQLLRISANNLTECPEHIVNLPNLAWFAFAGNPFSKEKTKKQYHSVPELPSSCYTLNEMLGQGASGIIYAAHWNTQQLNLPTNIAVKVFKGDITSDGYPHDELQACLQVGNHTNLVSALAQVNEDSHVALIMDLIPAHYANLGLPPSLQSCTRDTFPDGFNLPISVIGKVVTQMEEVFEYMHDKYVCHGDLYAHNTLFAQAQGDIIFGDFGAASCYQMLNSELQEKIKKIEYRAFIHFIEDLLNVCVDKDKATPLFEALQARINIKP